EIIIGNPKPLSISHADGRSCILARQAEDEQYVAMRPPRIHRPPNPMTWLVPPNDVGRAKAMLKRLYADNYRCLVNFELKLDRVNLLLGENGTGKTTVFEVLYRLQQFVAGNAKVLAVFPSSELTRPQTNSNQRFELELQIGEA